MKYQFSKRFLAWFIKFYGINLHPRAPPRDTVSQTDHQNLTATANVREAWWPHG